MRRRELGDADPLRIREISDHCGFEVSNCVKSLLDRGYTQPQEYSPDYSEGSKDVTASALKINGRTLYSL